jgi:2',3'-cyclic-nucleotide 2'-phosphodiesterase (5'-nucleotidase family)
MRLHHPHYLAAYLLIIQLFTTLLSKSLKEKQDLHPSPIIEILFHANLNGNIENCGCGDPPLGGLSRIVTLVKEKKEQNPELIYIDGGDFCNTYPFEELNQCVLDIYNFYTPDLMLTGDQEYIQGIKFLRSFLKQHEDHILGTNLRLAGHNFSRLKILNIQGISLALTTYLDTTAFIFLTKDKDLILDHDMFEQTYQRVKDYDIVITVFHGSASVLEKFKKSYPEITLILFAHEQNKQVNDEVPPFVVGGGADGEFVNWITLLKKESYFLLKNQQILIKNEIQPDKIVEEMIETYKLRLK